MNKELEVAFSNMEKMISDINNEIKILEKANKFVIIYKNESSDLYYGLMSVDANKVCNDNKHIHNIMPSPHPSIMKLFDNKDDAVEYLENKHYIYNGNDICFDGEIITYLEYLKLNVSEITNTYNELCVLRENLNGK